MIRNILCQDARFTASMLVALSVLTVTPSLQGAITGTTLVGNAGTSITAIPDPTDPGRLLVAGRSGTINAINLTTGAVSPYITFTGVNTSGEGGLLGIALDADYATNGYGYAYYTSAGSSGSALTSRIVRFSRDPANPSRGLASSITPMLSVAQPQNNHNGGWIGIGPNDGLLYIALGDGGGSDDSGTGHTSGTGNAQDITNNLLGKILRIDPSGDDFPTDAARNYSIPADNPFVNVEGDEEIWSYGLRNPFRNSFDSKTGDLWIADVGQNFREEVNFQPAASAGGENYGWRLREGTIATPSGGVGGPAPPGAIDPIYEYTHGSGPLQGSSITGGYVYRGSDVSLDGTYFFADFVSNNYFARDPSGTVTNVNAKLFPGVAVAGNPVSFAEDLQGNLYILTIGGNLYRINTTPPGDYNADGLVTTADYEVWAAAYGQTTSLAADGNGDGVVDAADYTIWRDNYTASNSAVPEPSSLMIVLSLAAASTSLRRPPAAK